MTRNKKTADNRKRPDRNGTMLQGFEWYLPCDHSLWKRLKGMARELAEKGYTSAWMPPATKGAFGDQGTGYAVYDLYDLGEFNQKGSVPTKYGTKEEYLAAIRACQKAGLQVYADIVLDHKIGADESELISAEECASNNRTLPVSGEQEIRAWTRFTFPGRRGKYSDFIWDCSCFDGIDWDEDRKKSAVFLFKGKSWNQGVDEENGNYDYLMGADLDFSSKKVRDELTRWGRWYLDTTGVDGFRLDAVKHISADFYRDWLRNMRAYAGRDLFAVGEYWNPDRGTLEKYLSMVEGEMSLFDVPLHFNFFNASNDGYNYDMRNILKGTLVEENPTHAVTFVDNHDTQPGQALCSYVQQWFRPHAYALILLRKDGYPCVFWGDECGVPNGEIPALSELPALLKVRSLYAYGAQHDYFDDPHCIGWTREESGLAVMLSAHADGCKHMYVGKQHAGRTYVDVLGSCPQKVTVGADGCGDFLAEDGKASVWLPQELGTTLHQS